MIHVLTEYTIQVAPAGLHSDYGCELDKDGAFLIYQKFFS
jgi:hypothetical protein